VYIKYHNIPHHEVGNGTEKYLNWKRNFRGNTHFGKRGGEEKELETWIRRSSCDFGVTWHHMV